MGLFTGFTWNAEVVITRFAACWSCGSEGPCYSECLCEKCVDPRGYKEWKREDRIGYKRWKLAQFDPETPSDFEELDRMERELEDEDY